MHKLKYRLLWTDIHITYDQHIEIIRLINIKLGIYGSVIDDDLTFILEKLEMNYELIIEIDALNVDYLDCLIVRKIYDKAHYYNKLLPINNLTIELIRNKNG